MIMGKRWCWWSNGDFVEFSRDCSRVEGQFGIWISCRTWVVTGDGKSEEEGDRIQLMVKSSREYLGWEYCTVLRELLARNRTLKWMLFQPLEWFKDCSDTWVSCWLLGKWFLDELQMLTLGAFGIQEKELVTKLIVDNGVLKWKSQDFHSLVTLWTTLVFCFHILYPIYMQDKCNIYALACTYVPSSELLPSAALVLMRIRTQKIVLYYKLLVNWLFLVTI